MSLESQTSLLVAAEANIKAEDVVGLPLVPVKQEEDVEMTQESVEDAASHQDEQAAESPAFHDCIDAESSHDSDSDSDSEEDVVFVSQRTSPLHALNSPRELVPLNMRARLLLKGWCAAANRLFRLIRFTPDCPAAILRNVYRDAANAVEVESNNEIEREWLLDESLVRSLGETTEACRLFQAMIAADESKAGIGSLVAFAILYRLRARKRHERGSLNERSKVSEILSTSTFASVKARANKALYLTSLLTPKNFFGVLLLSYMGLNGEGLEEVDLDEFDILVAMFSERIRSVGDLLPVELKCRPPWVNSIVPVLDFIVFQLIQTLDKLHHVAITEFRSTLPTIVQDIFPEADDGKFSTLLRIPTSAGLGELVSVKFPDPRLLQDQYAIIQETSKLFVEDKDRRMSHCRVDPLWFKNPRGQQCNVDHRRVVLAFADFRRKYTTQARRASQQSDFAKLVDNLEIGMSTDGTQFGRQTLPMPVRGWSPFTSDDWSRIPARYQPFVPGVEFGSSATLWDNLVRQAAQLVGADVIKRTEDVDRPRAPHVKVQVELDSYTIDVADSSKEYKS